MFVMDSQVLSRVDSQVYNKDMILCLFLSGNPNNLCLLPSWLFL